jgi:putative ABC transport system permease protein
VLRTDSIDASLITRIQAVPGVRAAEARQSIGGSVYTNTGWRSAVLMTAPQLDQVRIGVLKSESGDWPPSDDALVIETSSVDFADARIGQSLAVRVGNREPLELPVTGIARDVGLAPGWMEHVVYLFVTPATLARLSSDASLGELRIVARDKRLSREEVRALAQNVQRVIEATGRRVYNIDVPIPGRHIHAAQIDSLLYTQGAFGVLALLLSGFLVLNLVSAMLSGQVREIGVMKAIGASPLQLAWMYLALALGLGLTACAIGVPLAYAIGKFYAQFTASLLNFDISAARVPTMAIAAQVAVGLILPVLAASIPVIRASRMSVSEALRDVGIETRNAGRAFLRFPIVPRPLLLSLRNAFRRRARMALTLATLAIGGAVYLGAINLRAAVKESVDTLFGTQRFDMVVRFGELHSADTLESVARTIEGASQSEAWSGARGAVKRSDGSMGNSFVITAPSNESALLELPVTSGRWVSGNREIVVNTRLMDEEPTIHVGDSITLAIGGKEERWKIVGVTRAMPSPTAFALRDAITPQMGRAVVIKSASTNPAGQLGVMQNARTAFANAGIEVQSGQLMAEQRSVIEDHLLMVVGFLGIMAKLIIIVGGLGLASTMSLSVLERTREIGVMRAIGARHSSLLGMIQAEGLVIALLSWLVAIPLSAPMSIVLAQAFARVMFPVDAHLVPEASGVLQWLAVVVIVSIIACGLPALRATRIPTALALAYE